MSLCFCGFRQEGRTHKGGSASKAPSTPEFTWLMGILELFEEKDVSSTMEAICLAVLKERRVFSNMVSRHSQLANMGQGRTGCYRRS